MGRDDLPEPLERAYPAYVLMEFASSAPIDLRACSRHSCATRRIGRRWRHRSEPRAVQIAEAARAASSAFHRPGRHRCISRRRAAAARQPFLPAVGPSDHDATLRAAIERVVIPRTTIEIELTEGMASDDQNRILIIPWTPPSPHRRREIIQSKSLGSSWAGYTIFSTGALASLLIGALGRRVSSRNMRSKTPLPKSGIGLSMQNAGMPQSEIVGFLLGSQEAIRIHRPFNADLKRRRHFSALSYVTPHALSETIGRFGRQPPVQVGDLAFFEPKFVATNKKLAVACSRASDAHLNPYPAALK